MRTPSSRQTHTLSMSRGLPSDRNPVIRHAPADGSLDVFEDFEEVDDCLLVSGVVEDFWTTFYRLDGEELAPILGPFNWVERLVPTGSRDLRGLVQLLTEYALKHNFETDGSDPGAFVNEMARRDHESRWPKRPRWLDLWMHGDGPSV